MQGGLTVLMYHRVLPVEDCLNYPLPSLAMPVSAFREQVRWLREHCDVRPVREAVRQLREVTGKERPLVSLTFDDGYADNAELAAPILEEFDLRATFFVTTGFITSHEPLWFDRAADAWSRLSDAQRMDVYGRYGEKRRTNGRCIPQLQEFMSALKRMTAEKRDCAVESIDSLAHGSIRPTDYEPMSVEQVKRLAAHGHEIASHTLTHPILPLCKDEVLSAELDESLTTIREWSGMQSIGFCYPNGDVDDRVEQAVRDAGYAYACTTRAGINKRDTERMRLARRDITPHRVFNHRGEYDEIAFRAEISGVRQWWRRFRMAAGS